MITRDDVETYIASRPEAARWSRPCDTIDAIATLLLLHAPLHTWTTPQPPEDLLPADEITSLIADVTRPTLAWTRTDTLDVAELLIEAVAVDVREIDNTTIDWVVTNAHADLQDEILAAAGLDRGDVTVVSSFPA